MLIYENIRLAISGLIANKMRALLTMLGIIIGIASVIAIMTLGDSITATVADSMSSMGANNVMVRLQQREDETTSESGARFEEDDNSLEPKESDYITAEMIEDFYDTYADSITAVSVEESVGSGEVQQQELVSSVSVIGTSLGYFVANDISVLRGSYFSSRELKNGEMVAMVSEDVVEDIFDGDMDAAIGSTITVALDDKYYNFIVSAVYEKEEDQYNQMAMMWGGSDATNLYIPLQAAKAINHSSGYRQFTVVSNSEVNADDFAAEVEGFFGNIYRNNRHFEVSAASLTSIVEMMSSMMDTVTKAIAFIGSIALLVGGIGVMNIMLVSVTERTREIGTRKALGAPNSSIRIQFIIESVVICIIGGIIGIVLGCIVGMAAASVAGVSAVPSVKSILISLGFSMAIGIFFGYYPANKAAQLNPIDALRYE